MRHQGDQEASRGECRFLTAELLSTVHLRSSPNRSTTVPSRRGIGVRRRVTRHSTRRAVNGGERSSASSRARHAVGLRIRGTSRRAPRLTAATAVAATATAAATARDRRDGFSRPLGSAFSTHRRGPPCRGKRGETCSPCSPRRRATARHGTAWRGRTPRRPAFLRQTPYFPGASDPERSRARSIGRARAGHVFLARVVPFHRERVERARDAIVYLEPPRTRRVSLRLSLSLDFARSLVLTRWLTTMIMTMTTPTGVSYNYRRSAFEAENSRRCWKPVRSRAHWRDG